MRALWPLFLFAFIAVNCMFAEEPAKEIPQQRLFLSDMDLSTAVQEWGKTQINRSIRETKLSIAGKQFDNGVGTHASFSYIVQLKKSVVNFSSWVGVDDAADSGGKSSIRFYVEVDGETLFASPIMREGDEAVRIDLNLTGKDILRLRVDDAGDGINFDHANWADAVFTYVGEKPLPGTPWVGKKVILTPKPGPKPRINGPKVFGVRPGSPFLFTIPATGNQPISFFVENLPKGLTLDSKTGRLTGKILESGTYDCMIIASNALGIVKRPFKIECGEKLALTPHMGWNSWYIWGEDVTDRIIREAADAMVASGMINYGYQYINIDDCWAIKPGSQDPTLQGQERDENGMINANSRFPDMKALADYIHSKGLKAGIYTSPGRRTCAGFVGSFGYEEEDVRRFIEWGFDFLKYDWCSYTHEITKEMNLEELKKPYRLIAEYLKEQPRDIVLNLCQYGMGEVWKWGKEFGQSWRTSRDLGLVFEKISQQIYIDGFGLDGLEQYSSPGGYNDPDYLLIGNLRNQKGQRVPTPLTPDEQYTHVTLWALLAAPLIFSGDIANMDDFTLSLLTNSELIDINQDSLCIQANCIAKQGDIQIWSKRLEDGSKAIGIFNLDNLFTKKAVLKASDLGIEGKCRIRNIWIQKDLPDLEGEMMFEINPHGCMALRVWKRE